MKKLSITILIIGILIVSGYIYVRQSLTTNHSKNIHSQNEGATSKEAESPLDLRPLLITKLQQLVKEGSGGLYNLTMQEIKPDLLESKLEVMNAVLLPDTAALLLLDKLKIAPDDVFKISFHSLHINGIGIKDLLSKDVIDLKGIFITDPVIEVYHKKRDYNKNKREDTSTLYQRLMKQIKRIAVDKIVLQNGSFIIHQAATKKTIRFNAVEINMDHLLVDSSTQFDKSRFLFTKDANLSFKNFTTATPDKLYWIKAGKVSISATHRRLVATNISLTPIGTKEEFEKKLRHKQMMYKVTIPQVEFSAVNWWDLMNAEGLKADEINISKAKAQLYLNRSLPVIQKKMNDFPHQLLSTLKVPVHIKVLDLTSATISYEEYNPKSKKSGTVYIDKMNLHVTNLTNVPEQMQQNKNTSLAIKALFMHSVPMKADFKFDLSKMNSGNFTANVEMGAMDTSLLNPVTEPIGLFYIKKGKLHKTTAQIHGNNYAAAGKVLVLYNELHVTPLKPDNSDSGSLNKKHVTSFIANTFLIKNDNPSKGKLRIIDSKYKRAVGSDLFNLVWKTILVGILKTIGVPAKFADKK